jgi:formylglycine-generating enzyme required for sulfatase activity
MHANPSMRYRCDDCPVENVSWEQAQEFITVLNQETIGHYRLPTEAEWEFAARGGVLSKHYTYSGGNDLNEVAWYKDNSDGHTHPVGGKKPNELGLYDMSGNVEELCSDWDGHMRALPISPDNPKGPADGDEKIYRGGSFQSYETDKYSTPTLHLNFRGSTDPGQGYYTMGFRLVRDYP